MEETSVPAECVSMARSRMTAFATSAMAFVRLPANRLFLEPAENGGCRYELNDVTVADRIDLAGLRDERVCNV